MAETHVLIVEDEERVAETYALQLHSHETTVAHSGEEALEVLEEHGSDIDVVLLDRRMPGLSGSDVLTRIQESDYDAAVAMVTAVDPDFDIISMGFDDYLTKPIGKTELRETVDRLRQQTTYHDQVRNHLALVAKKSVLEDELDWEELERSEDYQQLCDEIADSRAELDVALAGDVFVELLLREVGDRLYLVFQYDADSWEYRYLGEERAEHLADVDQRMDAVVSAFRDEGPRQVEIDDHLALEGHACSLHLFETMVLLHFPQPRAQGLVCGFDPDAASHLTDFVSLVSPYVEQIDFEAVESDHGKIPDGE